MIWVLKTFWRSLTFVATVLGLLFLAQDFGDVDQALIGWRAVFAMISLTTALSISVAIAIFYIVWIDARPIIEKWRRSSRWPVSSHNSLVWESVAFDLGSTKFYKNFCYLVVFNKGRKRETAMNVSVKTFTFGDGIVCPTKSGREEVHIHPGDHELFLIGSIVSDFSYGVVRSGEVTKNDKDRAHFGVDRGGYTFDRGDKSSIGLVIGGIPQESLSMDPMSMMIARVSAQDTPPIEVRFSLKHEKLRRATGELVSPIEIVSITQL